MNKQKKSKERRRKTHNSVSNRIGVAWYRREQWNYLLAISSDRNELEDTYDEWQAMAEEKLRMLAQQGYAIRKVDIDVEALLSWCNSQARIVDGYARSEFTSVKLRELNEAGK